MWIFIELNKKVTIYKKKIYAYNKQCNYKWIIKQNKMWGINYSSLRWIFCWGNITKKNPICKKLYVD